MSKKTLKDFTPEIRAKIPHYKSIVKTNLYNGKEYETNKREDTVKYIEKIYEIAGFDKPVVILAKNPNQYKVFFELLQKKNKLIKYIYNNKNKLNEEINEELSPELRDKLFEEENIDYNSLKEELNKTKNRSHWLSFCSIYSRIILTWYKFIQDEFKIKTSKEKELNYLYSLINKTFISRCYFTKEYVLVLKTPFKINRTDVGLHSVKEAAIIFEGYEMFYSNNVRIKENSWKRIKNKTYTLEEYKKEDNEEVKSSLLMMIEELHGSGYLLEFLKAKKIDTFVDKKKEKYLKNTTKGMNIGVYTLLESEGGKYVRCFCPSTDRMFHLEVEPHYVLAKEAIASLLRIPVKLIPHIKAIRRQGERFSVIWTEEGKAIKKLLTKSDWLDRKATKGETYFGLMEYEY